MIRLTKLTDYAVVMLGVINDLTRKDSQLLLSANAIAQASALPEPTVSKVLKLLAKGGVIKSVRGAHGGYKMTQEPAEVAMSDVIEAIEGPITLVSCVEGSHENCPIESACKMRGAWDPVNLAVRTALENVSLQDMLSFRSYSKQHQQTESAVH